MKRQGMAVNIARHSEKSARIHPQTMHFRDFALVLHGFGMDRDTFPECLAMLAAMPRHFKSTSDLDFFVPNQVIDHIRSQEAPTWRNFIL